MVKKITVVEKFIAKIFTPMDMGPKNHKLLSLYLHNFNSVELTSALRKYNSLDFNKRHLFINSLFYNSVYYNDKTKKSFSLHTLDKELWRIKRGALNTNDIFYPGQSICDETIIGFIRAFEKGTVFTTKINIDGKVRRVFIKNKIGNMVSDGGYNHVILDPKSMFIYNLSGSSSITLKELSKLKINSKNRIVSKDWDKSLKSKYKLPFDKAINNYILKHKKQNILSFKPEVKSTIFSKIKKKFIRK